MTKQMLSALFSLLILFAVTQSAAAQTADLRVVHTSPGTPNVDVRLYTVPASPTVPNLPYPTATAYITGLAAGNYLAQAGVAGTLGTVVTGDFALTANLPYSVFAIDTLNLGNEPGNGLQLKAVIDTFLTSATGTAAQIRVAHFCPNAPAVDVRAKLGGAVVTLVPNVSFGAVTANTINVPATVNLTQDSVLVAPTGGNPIYAISFGQLLTGVTGSRFTVAAIGKLGATGAEAFQLKAFEATDTPASNTVSLKVVHTSPGTPNVDVRLYGVPAAATVPNLAYPNATGFLTGIAANNYLAQASVAGTLGTVVTGDFAIAGGLPYSVFAIDTLNAAKLNTGLKLAAVIDTFKTPDAGTAAQIRVAHFCPNAPAVDVRAKLGGSVVTLVQNVSFGGVTANTINVPATVNLTQDSVLVAPTGGNPIYAISFGDLLAGVSGSKLTVAAIGKLGATDAQAFQLKAYAVNSSLDVRNTDARPASAYQLEQNYPNPFNPATAIRFALPAANQVSLKVYDLLGREVATLVNERLSAGSYTVNFNGSRFASGVYLYRLTVAGSAGSQGFVQTRKMMLVK